jgi:hypothetical protein
VENHAVADVNVLFHDCEEDCQSTHTHKVAIKELEAEQKMGEILLEMQALSRKLPSKEGQTTMRNAAARFILGDCNEAPKQLPVSAA